MKQMLIAAGLARRIPRSEICRAAECGQSYITKNLKDEYFVQLVKKFDALPSDPDTHTYIGVSTLMKETARLTWSESDK